MSMEERTEGQPPPDQAGSPEQSGPTNKEAKRKSIDIPVRKGSIPLLSVLCAVLVFLEDLFFYDHPVGWTVGGYGLLVLGAILVAGRSVPRNKPAFILVAALVVLFLSCFEEPSPLTAVLGLLGLAMLGLSVRDGWVGSCPVWFFRLRDFLLLGWFLIFKDIFTPRRAGSQGKPGRNRGLRFVVNWFVPLSVGMIFLILFAAANPIISQWFQDVFTWFSDVLKELPGADRVLIWLGVAIWAWAFLCARTGIMGKAGKDTLRKKGIAKLDLTPAFFVRSLGLFNLIFAVQTVLDITYLFGGASLPEGMTWAEYAHRGAYPLLATALLAALFVLLTFREGPSASALRWARRLVYIWLAQNLFLVFTAGWRLCLYIEVYTLTRLRIAALIWMLLVACGLVYIVVRIVLGRTNLWLININALTALVALFACCFVNLDGLIADYNTRHCRELDGMGPEIDLSYLESLGPETLPALIRLDGALDDFMKKEEVRGTIARLQRSLERDLADWRGWTFRRQRLGLLDFPDK